MRIVNRISGDSTHITIAKLKLIGPKHMAIVTRLRVEIDTHETAKDNTCYIFLLPDSHDPVKITEAVYTLYGPEGVISLEIKAVEVDEALLEEQEE